MATDRWSGNKIGSLPNAQVTDNTKIWVKEIMKKNCWENWLLTMFLKQKKNRYLKNIKFSIILNATEGYLNWKPRLLDLIFKRLQMT